MRSASITTVRLGRLAIPAVAAVVGLLAAISPMLGIAAALGIAFVAVVISDLGLGVALFLITAFIDSFSAFGGLSLSRLSGALLAVAWIALVTTHRAETRTLAREHPVATGAIVLMGAWATVSAVWADFPATALAGAQRWDLNLVLFPIVYAAIRRPQQVMWLYAAFVAGALLSATVGAATGAATAADGARLAGSGINPNELGQLLIPAVVFGGVLGLSRGMVPAPARGLALGAAGVSMVLLLLTASREAAVGLAVALLVTPFVAGRGRRLGATIVIALSLFAAAAYVVSFAPGDVTERLTQADTSGTGRTDIWKVGWRMVQANPVLGVGADNYPTSTIHYLLEPGAIRRADFIVDDPKVAHNVYLQVQAELGIVGTVLFCAVLGMSLLSTLQAARAYARAGDRSMELLARGLLIALFGLLASEFFSSAIYAKQLWLLLALGFALRAMSPRSAILSGAEARRAAQRA
jgi:O-antigen ligase